jgi:hypothetical protein
MKIPKWGKPEEQMATLGRHSWSVSRLHQLAKDFPVMDVPLDHLALNYEYSSLHLRDMVMHINAILDADMSYPIILGEDGELLDGRHRLMKAMFEDHKTIKAVRVDENPPPCRVEEE